MERVQLLWVAQGHTLPQAGVKNHRHPYYHMFYITAGISILPSLFGKYWYSFTTLVGFCVGFIAGLIFGPNPGDKYGHTHYGWAIWLVIFFASVLIGIAVEIIKKKLPKKEQ